jgi:hypothetical protein
MATQSKARTVFDRSNTGIVGLNPARGMDVCSRFYVLCCPVYVEALRWADLQSKESYQMSKNRFIIFRNQILNRNRPEGLMRIISIKFKQNTISTREVHDIQFKIFGPSSNFMTMIHLLLLRLRWVGHLLGMGPTTDQ